METAIRLDSRSTAILNLLLAASDYCGINDLTQQTKLSRRTVYYDLCKINNWLELQGLPTIETERKRGIFIPAEQRGAIKQLMKSSAERNMGYIYTPTERVRLVVCALICAVEPVFIEQMAELCEVSRNTIVADLKVVAEKLRKYELELVYENRQGYSVGGDVVRKRALFMFYFSYLCPLFADGLPRQLGPQTAYGYYQTLKELEQQLNSRFVTGTLLALSMLMPVMAKGDNLPTMSGVDEVEIGRTREFGLVQRFFSQLCPREQCYLSLHLLGSRMQSVPANLLCEECDSDLQDMAEGLVHEFERIACVHFSSRKKLKTALIAHLQTSLYRYRYGIQMGNPLTEDIIREYPNLFRITRKAGVFLEQKVGLPIPDDEIGYLTMHFGGFLRSENSANRQLRILLVCPNGISTGNLLRGEVLALLPNARIADVVSMCDLDNTQKQYDLIISTVAIKSSVPAVVVHPILTQEDRFAILRWGMQRQTLFLGENEEIEPLLQLVSKYVPAEKLPQLRKELACYLQNRRKGVVSMPKLESPGILDLLDDSRIGIFDTAPTWQEAVRAACLPLLGHGSIAKEYVDKILLLLEVYGPYMFLSPGLILAHAKPSDGANRLDISLTVFHEPVHFSEDHYARVLLVLSPVDGERHLKILKDIITLFSVQSEVEELARCVTKQQVLQFLTERLPNFEEGQEPLI